MIGERIRDCTSPSCPVIKRNGIRSTYELVKLPDDSLAVTGTLTCTMKYIVKDCDPATGVPEEEEGCDDEIVVRLFRECWHRFLRVSLLA